MGLLERDPGPPGPVHRRNPFAVLFPPVHNSRERGTAPAIQYFVLERPDPPRQYQYCTADGGRELGGVSVLRSKMQYREGSNFPGFAPYY